VGDEPEDGDLEFDPEVGW
jgi:hypothetical protein